MDLQKVMDTLSACSAGERRKYHLTLGQAIDQLTTWKSSQPSSLNLLQFDYNDSYPGNPHSYRGYYSDLAFEPLKDWIHSNDSTTGEAFLCDLKHSLNREYTGWKGGEFLMDKDTPLWVANKGDCGRAITDIQPQNEGLVLITRAIE